MYMYGCFYYLLWGFSGFPWKRGEEEAWWICRCQFGCCQVRWHTTPTSSSWQYFWYSIINESNWVDLSWIMYGLHLDTSSYCSTFILGYHWILMCWFRNDNVWYAMGQKRFPVLSIGCFLIELERLLLRFLILDYKGNKGWFIMYGRNMTKLSIFQFPVFFELWVLSELLRLRYCGAFILDYEWFKMGWFVIHNV